MNNSFNFSIISASRVNCPPNWSWESDTNRWHGYHTWYVLKGGAKIKVGSNEYHLVPGDCFLFDLKYNHLCTHNPKNPLSVLSAYFQFRDDFDTPPLRHVIRSKDMEALLARTVEYFNSKDYINAAAWFTPVVSEFFCKLSTPNEHYSNIVLMICRKINASLNTRLSLIALSHDTNYSVNHLLRTFKKEMGISIYQYQLQQKILLAQNLLTYSNQSVGEIANDLGYYDISHFSKQFHKISGESPTEYRLRLQNYKPQGSQSK